MTTIEYTDGTTEDFARVRTGDGFAHCYEYRDTGGIDRNGFNRSWEYYLTVVLWVTLSMFQYPYRKTKVVPESRIEEIR